MPRDYEGVHTSQTGAPELREKDQEEGVVAAHKAVHVQGGKLRQHKLEHLRLESEVIRFDHLGKVVGELVLLAGNPLWEHCRSCGRSRTRTNADRFPGGALL